jgi:formate dehydrogenase major subunit
VNRNCCFDRSADKKEESKHMAVFATLFGKLARHLSPDSLVSTLQTHIGLVPNPLSKRSKSLQPRIHDAKMVKSVCPYCAVGCGQRVYVKEGKVVDIEGDYDSPISQGCLCPKGSASYQLDINQRRWTTVKYRAPYSTVWEDRPLDWAMERIARLVYETREATFRERDEDNHPLNHTLAIGSLGGATLDNEENYLITKLFHSLGMVCIENQARI